MSCIGSTRAHIREILQRYHSSGIRRIVALRGDLPSGVGFAGELRFTNELVEFEVYGDPLVHPQQEDYWGNVNPNGPRSCYDEAKRFAEAITYAYHRAHGVDVRVVRIFNTYGPRNRVNDGRVVPTFINQALRGEPLPVFGEGQQTRSFQYVDDLIEGIRRLMDSSYTKPVNIGNPTEMTILEFAN